jgi:hypothetical protein
MNEPRILVGVITADVKGYCQDEFLEQLKMLTYGNKSIYIVDNSVTNKNHKVINKRGYNGCWLPRGNKGVRQIIAESHDILRQHVIRNNYDYLFHFESDVFLNGNYYIIEKLLSHQRDVAAGCYDIGQGLKRQLCILLTDNAAHHLIPYFIENFAIVFMNGNLQKVYNAGLGACLISRNVLNKITFKAESNNGFFPDMNFARDLYDLNIPFYADTSLYLHHNNQEWGVRGIDYD